MKAPLLERGAVRGTMNTIGKEEKEPGQMIWVPFVPQEGLEPPRANAHYALNVARLPIPPLRRYVRWERSADRRFAHGQEPHRLRHCDSAIFFISRGPSSVKLHSAHQRMGALNAVRQWLCSYAHKTDSRDERSSQLSFSCWFTGTRRVRMYQSGKVANRSAGVFNGPI